MNIVFFHAQYPGKYGTRAGSSSQPLDADDQISRIMTIQVLIVSAMSVCR